MSGFCNSYMTVMVWLAGDNPLENHGDYYYYPLIFVYAVLSLHLSNTDLPQKAQREVYRWYHQAFWHFSSNENGFEMVANSFICQVVICSNLEICRPAWNNAERSVCVAPEKRFSDALITLNLWILNKSLESQLEESWSCIISKFFSGTGRIFRKLEKDLI